MSGFIKVISKATTAIALLCAIVNVNSTCAWAVYQPKLTDTVSDLNLWKKTS